MVRLKVPSLQHLARHFDNEPKRVQKTLVAVALNPPRLSYRPLFSAVRDLLVLHVPYEQVEEGIRRGIRRAIDRDNLLMVLPLIRSHFEGVDPDFVQAIPRRYYPIGRGLMVPFDPPLIYSVGGQLYLPWFSFWRRDPLARERLSLFVTLVDDLVLQDPDLERARFEILDFSIPAGSDQRRLLVRDTGPVPRVSEARKREMLDVLAEGYLAAVAELAAGFGRNDDETDSPDPRQGNLYE